MTIENLEIEITASSDKAASNLEKLHQVLEKINALGRATGLDQLYRKLKRIASLDFSKTAAGLGATVGAVDKLDKKAARVRRFADAVGNITKRTAEAKAEFRSFGAIQAKLAPLHPLAFSERSYAQNQFAFGGFLGDGSPNWTRWNPWGSHEMFDQMWEMWDHQDFGNVPASRRLGDGTLTAEFKDVTGAKESIGFIERLKDSFAKMRGNISQATDSMRSFHSMTKKAHRSSSYLERLLKRFLVYKILNVIVKGLSKGLQNIAMYSKEANENLTKYKSLATYMGNSIAASFIPMLNVLYPLVSLLTNAVVSLANGFNYLWSKMSGASTMLKAKKYTDDYAKSLGKLNGTASIDEIHQISQSTNYADMFETIDIKAAGVGERICYWVEMFTVIAGLVTLIGAKKWIRYLMLGKNPLSFIEAIKKVAPFLKVMSGILLIVGGIAAAVSGIIDWVKNGESVTAWLKIVIGLLAVGLGILILGGGWIPLLIAAIVAALVSIAMWGDKINAWLDGFKGKFNGWVDGIKDKIFGFFDNIIDKVKNWSPALAASLEIVKNFVGSIIDFFRAQFNWCITLFQDFVKLIKDLFHGDFKAVWEDLKKYFKDFWQGFVNVAIVPINFLISCVESFVNFFIRGLNQIIGGINKISFSVPDWVPGIGGKSVGFNISYISETSLGRLQGFEAGGFPEDGLFMANHGELVGGFSNGKTAVANNEQIIAGISRGVSEASAEQNDLLREQNRLLARLLEKESRTVIGVSTITKGLERQNRRNGKVIVPVGN